MMCVSPADSDRLPENVDAADFAQEPNDSRRPTYDGRFTGGWTPSANTQRPMNEGDSPQERNHRRSMLGVSLDSMHARPRARISSMEVMRSCVA